MLKILISFFTPEEMIFLQLYRQNEQKKRKNYMETGIFAYIFVFDFEQEG